MNLGEENEYQEFKESLSQLDKGLKSISAMLNKHGRGLYILALLIMEKFAEWFR